jgi:hypothetical protein
MFRPYELEGLPWSYKIYLRSGIVLNGTVYPLEPVAHPTDGTEYGSSHTAREARWQTPTVHMAKELAAPSEFRRNSPTLTAEAVMGSPKALWPTPSASDNRDRGNLGDPCVQKRLSTGKQLGLSMVVSKVSGKLNPTWVEWLMGYPEDHTDLGS